MNSENTGQVLDFEIALANVDGDRQFLSELIALFIQDYPRLRDEARKSIQQCDPSSLERAAHTLKGRLSFFGIQKAREQAIALETIGRTGDLSCAKQVLADVETEMESVLFDLESISREQNV
jgi:HPt (histidine-containing phosphotransfer) domain-containing protein